MELNNEHPLQNSILYRQCQILQTIGIIQDVIKCDIDDTCQSKSDTP